MPTITGATLEHGPELLLVEDHGLPLVALAVVARAGQRHEPAGREGLAQLSASLLLEGSIGGDRNALLDRYGELGTTPHVAVGPSLVGLQCTVRTADVPAALRLLVDNLRQPTFSDEAFERVRRDQHEGLAATRGVPTASAGLGVLLGSLGVEPPAALLTSGTMQSIAALPPEAVRQWLASHVRPDALTFLLAGDVSEADARRWIGEATQRWPAAASQRPPPPEQKAAVEGARPRTVLVPWPSLPQVIIAVGGPRVPYGHADEPAETLVGHLLRGVLHHELRTRQRTTYGVVPGGWSTKLGRVTWLETKVEPANLKEAVEGVIGGLDLLVEDPTVGQTVIEDLRQSAMIDMMDGFHGPEATLGQLLRLVAEGLPSVVPAQRLARLQALAASDLKVAVRRIYDPAAVRLCMVGDEAALDRAREALPEDGVVVRRPGELLGLDSSVAPSTPA